MMLSVNNCSHSMTDVSTFDTAHGMIDLFCPSCGLSKTEPREAMPLDVEAKPSEYRYADWAHGSGRDRTY